MDDRRAIRHLDHIGHMAGCRSVEDNVAARLYLEHFGNEHPCIQRGRFPRLKIDCSIIGLLHMADQFLEQRDIIVLTRYMMPAPEVQPFHPVKIFAELLLHCRECHLKSIRSLLTERMKVQSFDSLEQVFAKVCKLYAQPRAGGTGVIDCVLLGRASGIDADAAGRSLCTGCSAKARPLSERIEDDVVADLRKLTDLLRIVGRLKDVILLAHFLLRETRLIDAARRCPGEILPDQRIVMVHGETLLSEKHLCSRIFCDPGKNFEILLKELFVDEIGGGRDLVPLRPPFQFRLQCHQSTSTGARFSCHGRPQMFRASINGSGSNSSTLNTPGRRHFPVITIIAPIIAGTPVV